MTDDFHEWLRLAEEAFSVADDHRVEIRANAWSDPVAWLANTIARQA